MTATKRTSILHLINRMILSTNQLSRERKAVRAHIPVHYPHQSMFRAHLIGVFGACLCGGDMFFESMCRGKGGPPWYLAGTTVPMESSQNDMKHTS